MTTVAGPLQEPVREEIVVYGHPLLHMKIWEIGMDPPSPAGGEAYGPWHHHKEVELLAMVEGAMGMQTQDGYLSLGPGDVALLGVSQLHRTHRAGPAPVRFIVLQVDLGRHLEGAALPYLYGLSEGAAPLGRLNELFRDKPEVRRETYALVSHMYEEYSGRERGYELAIGSAIQRLLWLFVRYDEGGLLPAAAERDLLRLRPALDYVDSHLQERITVEEVSRLLNFSYHYFIRYFRSAMGCSFVDYVNRKRIKAAERLLLTRDLSIAEAALEAGVPSIAQFYKLFKRFNRCSPKEFVSRMSSREGV
ncbi:helix-turn-helix domain-containing protein [Cohnella sp. JJ-181]|uniref:helix-turn-helix domain-containing protein n=1 Tax=Cohnella rhizoplanae TaxID=2974897 RepID=UPI0022FF7B1E|nr:AraC family transcriptional regulator [Cohnella sp. JJ-181]CAI6087456.1 hypothetical protein COHCIP112018_05538 [Cohnella sp. JJ-181]